MSFWKSQKNKTFDPNNQADIDSFLDSDFNSWAQDRGWQASYPRTKSYYRPALYGYVAISMKDGNVDYYYLSSAQQRDAIIEHAKDWSMVKPFDDDLKEYRINNKDISQEDRVVCINVNEADIKWQINRRTVATCVYNATNDYMGHMFGMSMDTADKDWYSQYDKKVTSHGCTGSWVLTVIQQLIEPYGLAIDRVRVKPGSMRYEEHRTFMTALGANPFFVQDGTTSNMEALGQMNIDVSSSAAKDLINSWRFHCDQESMQPSICLDQFDGLGVGAHSGGAFYIGPRGHGSKAGFRMAISLKKNTETTYHQDLELDSYAPHPGSRQPILGSIKIGDSTLTKLSTYNRPYSNGYDRPYSSGSFTKTPTNSFPHIQEDGEINSDLKNLELEYPPVCEHCQRAIDGAKITTEWGKGRCPHCNNVLEKNWKSTYSR